MNAVKFELKYEHFYICDFCDESWEDPAIEFEGKIPLSPRRVITVNENTICEICLAKLFFCVNPDYREATNAFSDYAMNFFGGMSIEIRDLKPTEKMRRDFSYKIRKQVLERDAYRCVVCESYKNLHVDHIIPIAKGGTNDIDNLQVLCANCNLSKGAKDDKTWKQSITPKS